VPSAAFTSVSVSDSATVSVSLGDVAPRSSQESSEEDRRLRPDDDRALLVGSKESSEEDRELRPDDDRALLVGSKESTEEDRELRPDDDRVLPDPVPAAARARSSACVCRRCPSMAAATAGPPM